MLLQRFVDGIAKLRILLAKCHGQRSAGPHGDVRVHRDVFEHLAPELGQKVVHDGDRGETGVHHLEHVIVFEDDRGLLDHDRGLAARLQLGTQAQEVLLVEAPFADEHCLTREIVHRSQSAALPDR